MRISSVTMYEQSAASINRQQGEFLKISQQMASGRRVVNPSDDLRLHRVPWAWISPGR